MTSIDLYYMPESPPCRLVEMVASFASVDINKKYINLFTKEHLKDDYIKVNPRHKVPFLVDGDFRLSESRAIACYLANKYLPANNTLYPIDPIKRAKVDELLYMDATVLWPGSSSLFYPLIGGKSKSLDSEAEQNFINILAMFDKRLEESGKKYFTGDDITLGDLSIAMSLQVMQSFGFEGCNKFAHLQAFLKNVEAFPKYHEINDEPFANMKKYFENIGKN